MKVHSSQENKQMVNSIPTSFAKNLKAVINPTGANVPVSPRHKDNVKNQVFIIFEYIFIEYCRRL
jgi:hypothetical protein